MKTTKPAHLVASPRRRAVPSQKSATPAHAPPRDDARPRHHSSSFCSCTASRSPELASASMIRRTLRLPSGELGPFHT